MKHEKNNHKVLVVDVSNDFNNEEKMMTIIQQINEQILHKN